MSIRHRGSHTDPPDGDAPGPPGGEETPVRTRRFKRSAHAKPAGADPPPDSVEALLAELMLLREENAWLKAARHQPPGVERAISRARDLPAGEPDGDLRDDATQILVEAHVLRESLLELTAEIQAAMARVQAALEALTPDENGAPQQASVIQMGARDGTY